MALYQNINGVWTICQRPYVLRSSVWVAANEAWVKRSGVWTQAYEYDVTPPNPPEITLNIHEDRDGATLKSRWIRIGVRLPGAVNDPDARLSRVLTDYGGKPPTTQFGGTWTAKPDSSYPSEPWSEWRYNSFGTHKDTSLYIYKQWPLNPTAGTIIAGDRDYHFKGWSLDQNGNWSAGNLARIFVPKASVQANNIIIKEARFQPNSSGSWRSSGFASGDLVQQNSPRSQGLWFYGNQFTDSIGAQTSGSETIKVRDAQIYILRKSDDIGSANANIYLFRTAYAAPSSLPAPGSSISGAETTKLGTLAKGQGKWFALPAAYYNNLNTGIKGLGLAYKDPIKAAAFPEDYSRIVSTAANLRCGEVHVVWEETL